MARIRTIKPEFWTDDRVGECSVSARLLFIAAWNFADDHGGLDRSAKQLKAQAFPYDNIDCEPLVQELLNAGLLIEYEVGGKKYLHIKGFRQHQKVEKPAKPRVPVYDNSPSPPRVLPESSHGSGGDSPASSGSSLGSSSFGREGKGSDSGAYEVAQTAESFARIKAIYPAGIYRQHEWLNAERDIEHHVANGHSWAEVQEGVERYARQIQATGNTGTQYVLSPAKFFARGPQPKFLEPYPLPAARAGPSAVKPAYVPSPTTAELEAMENARAS